MLRPSLPSAGTTALLLGALLVASGPAAAQDDAWPTLWDLWPGYSSPAGTVQFALSGRLDVEGYVPGDDPAWLIPGTDPFATGRLRLFGDLFVGDSWLATGELRVDGGEAPEAGRVEARLEQLWVRWSPRAEVTLQVGKFVSPFGSYPRRHHTDADPLIRPPLHYEYRTMVLSGEAPPNGATFLGWKDEPDRARFRAVGAPPVWGAPYQWGGMLQGERAGLSYRVAVLNSAPSSEPEEWEWDADRLVEAPSFVAALGYRFAPLLRVELWYDRGPYMKAAGEVEGPIPAGSAARDYDQVLLGGEAVIEYGHTIARLEAVHDRWEVPNVVEDPIDVSYSLELQQTLRPGLFVAGRYGGIRFNEISATGGVYQGGDPDAARDIWDYPVHRVQLGAGYRLARNAEIRAEYAWNGSEAPAALDPADNLFSVQLWWGF